MVKNYILCQIKQLLCSEVDTLRTIKDTADIQYNITHGCNLEGGCNIPVFLETIYKMTFLFWAHNISKLYLLKKIFREISITLLGFKLHLQKGYVL